MLKATFRSAGLAALALGLAACPALADEDVAPKRRTSVVVQQTAAAPIAMAMPFVIPPCAEAYDALVLRCARVPQVVVDTDPVQGHLLRTIRGDYNGPYPAIVPDP